MSELVSKEQYDEAMAGWTSCINDLRTAVGLCRGVEIQRDALNALINTPEIQDFDKGVPLEAAHQVIRWGSEHDAGKNPEDWFWLIGYLAGKALHAHKMGDMEKAKHHCISTAAALRNWHSQIRSGESAMRPGIEPPSECGRCGGTGEVCYSSTNYGPCEECSKK